MIALQSFEAFGKNENVRFEWNFPLRDEENENYEIVEESINDFGICILPSLFLNGKLKCKGFIYSKSFPSFDHQTNLIELKQHRLYWDQTNNGKRRKIGNNPFS